MSRYGSFTAFACLAAALWLFGCADSKPRPETDFTLKDLSGKSVTLSDFKGKSNVLVHFGTTWCPPCIAEIPKLNELSRAYGDKLVILYVDINEMEGIVRKLVQDKGIQYTTLLDPTGEVANSYNVTGIPQNILIDKDGMIRARKIAIPEGEIAKLVGK